MRVLRRSALAAAAGGALAIAAALANAVPQLLDEVGTPRAERSGTAQVAEFFSLVFDSGWGWAVTAIAIGWWASRDLTVWHGAAAGSVSLATASLVYVPAEAAFAATLVWGWALLFWTVAGLVLGLPLGAIGAAIRRPGAVGVVAALVAPAGAALSQVLFPPPASAAGTLLRWVVWVVAAAVAATVLLKVRARQVLQY